MACRESSFTKQIKSLSFAHTHTHTQKHTNTHTQTKIKNTQNILTHNHQLIYTQKKHTNIQACSHTQPNTHTHPNTLIHTHKHTTDRWATPFCDGYGIYSTVDPIPFKICLGFPMSPNNEISPCLKNEFTLKLSTENSQFWNSLLLKTLYRRLLIWDSLPKTLYIWDSLQKTLYKWLSIKDFLQKTLKKTL